MGVNYLPFAGSLLSGLGSALFSHSAASKAFDRQKELWEYMQSNAHQLEVQDLRKAGLNPILSATNSQLASMPSVQQEHLPTMDLGSVLTSAFQASIQDKATDNAYELGKISAKQKDRELDIEEARANSAISLQREQKEMVSKQIEGIMIDNAWKPILNEKDWEVKDAMIREKFAEAKQAIAESELIGVQREKLEYQLKYGEIFVKYLPPKAADVVLKKLMAVVQDPDFENKFINPITKGKDEKEAAMDVYEVLKRRGILGGD